MSGSALAMVLAGDHRLAAIWNAVVPARNRRAAGERPTRSGRGRELGMAGRRATLVAILGVILVACSAGAEPSPAQRANPDASQDPPSLPAATPSPSPRALTATPSVAPATPTPPPDPSPTEGANPNPPPTSIKPGDVAETLVAKVRVRSEPRVADSSYKYEPLLPSGTKLYVVDGPVAGSGYQWFWVAQLSSTELPSGWVAAAGRDGEAWLGKGDYHCPATPTDVASFLSLPRGAGLACFSRLPISFKARLFDCNCDVDTGNWIVPNWLFSVGAGPMITEPSAVRRVAIDSTNWTEMQRRDLLLDPEGTYPAELPIGYYIEGATWSIPPVVRITGMFDHPAAATCKWQSEDPMAAATFDLAPAVGTCRLEFAVTRIVVP